MPLLPYILANARSFCATKNSQPVQPYIILCLSASVRHICSPPEEGHREASTHSQSAEVSTDVKDVVARFVPSLIRRWRESHPDGMQLWREMRVLGSPHAARMVSRCIPELRRAAAAGHAPEAQSSPSTRPQGPSARAVSFVL